MAALLNVLSPAPAAAQSFTLTLHLNGESSGTVTVAPTGDVCGTPSTVCTFLVPARAPVRLAANGAIPGLFSAGTGAAASCGLTTCSFTMLEPGDVTATFSTGNGPTATVSTNFAGPGTGSVGADNSRCQNFDPAQFSACTTTYLVGSVVTLAAAPAAGNRFSRFSSGTSGADACGFAAVCTFTLAGNATLTATFHTITALVLSPRLVELVIGQSQTFVATGTYTDGVKEPVLPGPGTWLTRPDLPTPRYGLGAAAADTRLYAIGGIESGVPSGTVSVLETTTGAWSAAAPMAVAREGFATAAIALPSAVIFVMGGNTTGSAVTDTVERYSPSANTWSQCAWFSTPRRYQAGAYMPGNGTLYAVGGESVLGGVATVIGTLEALSDNCISAPWVAKAPMPTPRKHLAAAAANGILYAIGGTDASGTALDRVEAYNPATNSWSGVAPLPSAMAAPKAAAIDGAIYVVGATATHPAELYEYDSAANVWTVKSSMPSARSGFGIAPVNGAIYTVGGLLPTSLPSGRVEAFLDTIRWGGQSGAVRLTQLGEVTALSRFSSSILAVAGTFSCTMSGPSCASVGIVDYVMSLDSPSNNGSVTIPFPVQGWAMTRTAASGTGVDAVHVYAAPSTGGTPIFLGPATYGIGRPDIGALFGSQFTNSGFELMVLPGMLSAGSYELRAYGHNSVTNAFEQPKTANITVSPAVSSPIANVDWPVANATLTSAFEVGGWVIDQAATSGTGIDGVQFYVQPDGTPAPGVFVGTGSYGIARTDVGGLFGAQFTNSGFHFTITGLGPGSYTLAVHVHSTVTGAFSIAKTVPFTVNGNQLMSIDAPSPEATVTGVNFAVSGWSIDRAEPAGSGVDALHIYAYPDPGSGQAPIFLGVATVGIARSDVGAIYGARFTNSGYTLNVDGAAAGLTSGVYNIAVHSHSTSGTFNNLAVVRITIQ